MTLKLAFCESSDDPNEDLVQPHISKTNDFIHEARLRNGAVLVHCLAGISRSTTLVVAYVMTVTNYGWKDSLNIVRAIRHEANPNIGFKKQLRMFEIEVRFMKDL